MVAAGGGRQVSTIRLDPEAKGNPGAGARRTSPVNRGVSNMYQISQAQTT